MVPTNVMVVNITGTSAVVMWTISNIAFTFEQYRVDYGISPDTLTMMSSVVYGTDVDAVNETYTVTLDGLDPLTTYHIQVVSTNSEFSSSTAITNFTTDEDGM